jgi:hypothetical protein
MERRGKIGKGNGMMNCMKKEKIFRQRCRKSYSDRVFIIGT